MKAFKILYVIPVLVVLGYAVSGYIADSSTSTILPYNYSPEKYQAALESGKPTVLELGADWCQVCVKMMPVMEELEAEYPEVNFITANIDVEKELVNKYRVIGTPTFVFYDASGKEARIVVGYHSKDSMASFIKGP